MVKRGGAAAKRGGVLSRTKLCGEAALIFQWTSADQASAQRSDGGWKPPAQQPHLPLSDPRTSAQPRANHGHTTCCRVCRSEERCYFRTRSSTLQISHPRLGASFHVSTIVIRTATSHVPAKAATLLPNQDAKNKIRRLSTVQAFRGLKKQNKKTTALLTKTRRRLGVGMPLGKICRNGRQSGSISRWQVYTGGCQAVAYSESSHLQCLARPLSPPMWTWNAFGAPPLREVARQNQTGKTCRWRL